MQDIVSAIKSIKNLEYQYLYKSEPYTGDLYEEIIKIMLADMKNLNIFKSNGLQLIFLLVERSIFFTELYYFHEEAMQLDEETISEPTNTFDDIGAFITQYKNKRFDSDSIAYFKNKILEFDDVQAFKFLQNIEQLIDYNGDIELLSCSINEIIKQRNNDYVKTYNLCSLLKTI